MDYGQYVCSLINAIKAREALEYNAGVVTSHYSPYMQEDQIMEGFTAR